MEIKLNNSYGILTKNELIVESTKGQNKRTALLGQIVKIDCVLENQEDYNIRFLKDVDTWESTSFTCPMQSVESVDERFWTFLAAVTSPKERVKLAINKQRVSKLLQITTDVVVGFNGDEVYLGTVKFIGNVKGMGKCFGIQLHEKKISNTCDGSCAGIQYFHCLPGYGVFTTADKIIPYTYGSTYSANDDANNEPATKIENATHIDEYESLVQKNISRISLQEPSTSAVNGTLNNQNGKSSRTKVKSSPSLQALMNENSVNTNNDFDQNSILQSENIYLLEKARHVNGKRPVDLIEAIGSWSPNMNSTATNDKDYKRYFNAIDGHGSNTLSMNGRNGKVKNVNNSLINGSASKTMPRKFKNIGGGSEKVKQSNSKFYIDDHELNERLELARKTLPSTSAAAAVQEDVHFAEPLPNETNDLVIGSMVEVLNDVSEEPLYGVVRWMGKEEGSNFVVAGVELEDEPVHLPLTLSDGTYKGRKLVECSGDRVLFVPITQCHKDSRFQDGIPTPVHTASEKTFGKDCPVIPGAVPPLIMKTEEDVEAVCGQFRGIQGRNNSCYLDATLFAMFTYTAVFDNLLFRPREAKDIPEYEEVQRVLREEIVNPLRKNLFVRADRVMNLRQLLNRLSSVSGLMSEEKDPEEFLNSLLAQILKAEPFLKLNSGQDAYYYQLFVEKDDELKLPTVQQLFEQSFLTSNIKLREVPACLIIQMPRFGKSFKMYPRILPSQLLDVTDIIDNSPRQCTVCGKLAEFECRDCFGECGEGLESTAFCNSCLEMAHKHLRKSHKPVALEVPPDFAIISDHCPPPRLYMELFAVICIETSHYVAFVKCGAGHEAPWCFFDSMADRKGELNGYNIPEMVACPDVSKWLSDEQACRELHDNSVLDRHLPEHARRLLCDAYICMYQSSDVMMYN
ncbi:ubiquitin carboxyl-terminal hydrolase CYLD [Atheta coriaria]|uniref:ubiquitin carboxyl-terminal hydrolase CYLD n=1 Tax=Dalotia coriaria TaxID=877792 RepID=UPI0031F3F28E